MKVHMFCSYTDTDTYHDIAVFDFVVVPRIGESVWIAGKRYEVKDVHYEVPSGDLRSETIIPKAYAKVL